MGVVFAYIHTSHTCNRVRVLFSSAEKKINIMPYTCLYLSLSVCVSARAFEVCQRGDGDIQKENPNTVHVGSDKCKQKNTPALLYFIFSIKQHKHTDTPGEYEVEQTHTHTRTHTKTYIRTTKTG